jgi:hypothetical protein
MHYLNSHKSKLLLISQINGLTLTSKKNKRKLIKAKTVSNQGFFCSEKRYIKKIIRHYLLAYAFLEQKSYKSVERSCKEQPSASEIFEIIKQLGLVKNNNISQQSIQQWMSKSEENI